MKKLVFAAVAVLSAFQIFAQPADAPIHLALIGLVHDHALGFIPRIPSHPQDVSLVGIVEPDQALCDRYAARFHLDKGLFFHSLDDLLAHTNVQACALFTSAYDHRQAVEECASHGLDVMMEKPLAVSMEHAEAIAHAAAKAHINVIVNYETTWYPGNKEAGELAHDGKLGELRKIVVHMGHRGPREIGCSETFLSWLTDPKLNGGGALIDFGCYGADLSTWLMDGARPLSVTAVTQHIKPDIYPKVDDEATIVVVYPKTQSIIQASWNWPFDRKDMEIYGRTGYVIIPHSDALRIRLAGASQESARSAAPLEGPASDSIPYFAAVVRKQIKPSGLSSLPVNLVAQEILDAARKSASTGKRVDLSPNPPFGE